MVFSLFHSTRIYNMRPASVFIGPRWSLCLWQVLALPDNAGSAQYYCKLPDQSLINIQGSPRKTSVKSLLLWKERRGSHWNYKSTARIPLVSNINILHWNWKIVRFQKIRICSKLYRLKLDEVPRNKEAKQVPEQNKKKRCCSHPPSH